MGKQGIIFTVGLFLLSQAPSSTQGAACSESYENYCVYYCPRLDETLDCDCLTCRQDFNEGESCTVSAGTIYSCARYGLGVTVGYGPCDDSIESGQVDDHGACVLRTQNSNPSDLPGTIPCDALG